MGLCGNPEVFQKDFSSCLGSNRGSSLPTASSPSSWRRKGVSSFPAASCGTAIGVETQPLKSPVQAALLQQSRCVVVSIVQSRPALKYTPAYTSTRVCSAST